MEQNKKRPFLFQILILFQWIFQKIFSSMAETFALLSYGYIYNIICIINERIILFFVQLLGDSDVLNFSIYDFVE
jgi:hypothetical protein